MEENPVGMGKEGQEAPLVSVVVPAYGRAGLLREALLSLFGQDMDKGLYEVIVVDSSPDEGVRRMVEDLKGLSPCVLKLFVKDPEGPGPSRNMGVKNSRGRFIAFMDSDCQATPGWLRSGLAAFEEGVGIVQGRTLARAGARKGVFTHYIVVEGESFIYECANIFYRREAFDGSGGFVRDYCPTANRHMGGEDLDLAWKVKRAGWKSRFAAEALVYHEVLPIPVTRWIFIKHMYIWPLLARDYPEIRRYFFARYFFDRHQAALLVAIAGLALGFIHPATTVLALPYALSRGTEPSATLKGPLRPLRVLFYISRDLTSLFILLAGCIRFRSVLL